MLSGEGDSARVIACASFIHRQIDNMPDYLKPAFTLLALALNALSLISAGGLFTRIAPEARLRVMDYWSRLPGPASDFLLFHKTLTAFYIFHVPGTEGSDAG